jgi:hypothetical protein
LEEEEEGGWKGREGDREGEIQCQRGRERDEEIRLRERAVRRDDTSLGQVMMKRRGRDIGGKRERENEKLYHDCTVPWLRQYLRTGMVRFGCRAGGGQGGGESV